MLPASSGSDFLDAGVLRMRGWTRTRYAYGVGYEETCVVFLTVELSSCSTFPLDATRERAESRWRQTFGRVGRRGWQALALRGASSCVHAFCTRWTVATNIKTYHTSNFTAKSSACRDMRTHAARSRTCPRGKRRPQAICTRYTGQPTGVSNYPNHFVM